MTTLREAAQQALEALEGKRYTACGWRSDCDKAITALRAALAEPPDSTKPVVESETASEPVQERNFCPRCGKRTNDIHTCTPPLTEQGCDHCRHVLYAATKCKNCGRVTE